MSHDTGVPASPSGYSAEPEPCSTVSAVPVSVPNADEIEAALRLKALLDGIDAAGGTITVEFPEGDPQ
jgi:hypothetical protein